MILLFGLLKSVSLKGYHNEKFWELTKQHLKQIYFSYILPELVYPRIIMSRLGCH